MALLHPPPDPSVHGKRTRFRSCSFGQENMWSNDCGTDPRSRQGYLPWNSRILSVTRLLDEVLNGKIFLLREAPVLIGARRRLMDDWAARLKGSADRTSGQISEHCSSVRPTEHGMTSHRHQR